jgi:superfamily I DNA/RNA helicase
MTDEEELKRQIAERKKFTDFILNSKAKNKIIVAGPGTGKSFTFKSLVTMRGTDSLALTFINNLANDLAEDLSGLAQVHTFHGYCKSLLYRIAVAGIDVHFNYFPKLPLIIQSDALVLASHLRDFEEAIQKLDTGERIDFFIERANYYNAVGHNDAVYRILEHFTQNPKSIPSFAQIVVDEYQDFNPLEVAFIEQLALSNPILLAGDDDQAIYSFKHASPEYIRRKAIAADYERFELPYCSRSTEVIVSSVIQITERAKAANLLRGRLEKKYFCFLPEKKIDSEIYPKIICASCSIQNKQEARNYIGKFIESEIKKIPHSEIQLSNEKNYPGVLIIGPSQYLKQVYAYLKDKFPLVDYKQHEEEYIDIFNGYKLLMSKEDSNLGWRILLEFEDAELRKQILLKSHETGQNIVELLDVDYIKKQLALTKILHKIIKNEELTAKEKSIIENAFSLTFEKIKSTFFKIIETPVDAKKIENSIKIKLTTINGSKGMSGGFVFMVGMNNGNLPRNANSPTDHEICQFIVALTRTRKRCYLISNQRFGASWGIRKSVFISWINPNDREEIQVNADYIRKLAERN